jgi:GTP pyrophosphokinase
VTIQVREAVVDAEPGEWLAEVSRGLSAADAALVARAFALAGESYGARPGADGEPLLGHCREVASILGELRMEGESVAAALLSAMPEVEAGWSERVSERIGAPVAALIEGVARMAQIQGLRAKVEGGSRPAERAGQLEALRKMLLAMVQDARVVLIKLADQTQTLRFLAGRGEPAARAAAARDTLDLFAPLANRLGVWQLKWELEDLALRCLDPATYKAIARELHEKRPEREAYIAEVARQLERELAAEGVRAQVVGRPKHIYSIYSKLKRKDLTLKELFDVRGVRVLVEDVRECYAALGLVHSLWTPLPKEFDDYIAKPKPNNYRSLHTAVVGPDGKVLEVQIRTHEMHRHNEYGVAAHWRYKEAGGSRADEARSRGESRRSVASFEERVGWLRQILEWRDELADVADLAEHFRTGLFEDTVYVLTPQGRVIDLPQGATPVDFAYHVHSDLGHRCRGARVDGAMVPLNTRLANGQTVEIVAAKSGGPSRDWLNPELGTIHSSRARAKVRQWFNTQNLESALSQGRQIVERVLQRAGMTALSLDKLAAELHFDRAEDLLAAVGRNELTARQIQTALQAPAPAHRSDTAGAAEPAPLPPKPVAPQAKSDILVVGVDKLLTVLARCCKPAPPDPITGFVTRGRGVTVHRAACPNVLRLSPERLIEAQWGAQAARGAFAVDVEVDGGSRPELMRDVLDVFAREKVRVLAARSHTRDARARLYFTVEIADLNQLRRLLALVGELSGVAQARRA